MTIGNEKPPISDQRDAALDWLYGRINYEHRTPAPYAESHFRLDRMRRLLDRLDRPDAHLRIVHVAGTKGKGSTSAMLASVLTDAGYRVGLFSSPHLDRVEERIAIGTRPCSAEQFVRLVGQVAPVVEAMDRQALAADGPSDRGPTYFEVLTALGLLHFRQQQVDLAILEVGMGGRLDSTNVCTPVLSIITQISIDHTQQLGSTLLSIAREKAGIIKPAIPVVSGVTEREPRDVIRRVAADRGASLIELGRDFRYSCRPAGRLTGEYGVEVDVETIPARCRDRRRVSHQLRVGLLGRHQAANAATAVAALEELQRLGVPVPRQAVRHGLARVRLPARIEVLSERPTIVVDAAHNPASAKALIEVLDQCRVASPKTLVFAASRDKDIAGMLSVLGPHFDRIVLTRYRTNPRALDLQQLFELATSVTETNCVTRETPQQAWDYLRSGMTTDETVVVAGSFFLAAEMRRLILARSIEDTESPRRDCRPDGYPMAAPRSPLAPLRPPA